MADPQAPKPPEPATPACKPRIERRNSPRDVAPSRGEHDGDHDSDCVDANVPPVPHMAESEPVVVAEVVTRRTRHGKTTIVVERCPGQATHVTVVDEKDHKSKRSAPPKDETPDEDEKSEKK